LATVRRGGFAFAAWREDFALTCGWFFGEALNMFSTFGAFGALCWL